MLSRIFPGYRKHQSKGELLELTLKHFHPLPTCEVETLFKTTKCLLNNLTENDFDEKFDKIVFGTIVFSLVIETQKYGIPYYPVKNKNNYNILGALNIVMNSQTTEKMIFLIGEKVLSSELPFDSSYIEKYFSTFATNVPAIKKRANFNKSLAWEYSDSMRKMFNSLFENIKKDAKVVGLYGGVTGSFVALTKATGAALMTSGASVETVKNAADTGLTFGIMHGLYMTAKGHYGLFRSHDENLTLLSIAVISEYLASVAISYNLGTNEKTLLQMLLENGTPPLALAILGKLTELYMHMTRPAPQTRRPT